MQDPLIGQQLEGYTIRALLGSGGMAQVYRAHDPVLNREVALKLLDATIQRQPSFADRFRHEARTLASFQHAGIVQIYDIGTYQGRPYLVQELLPGPTLDDELAAARAQGAFLPFETVTDVISSIASALDYAHARGIIHRDLKPANLMRNTHGRMVLMDFGIAKAITGSEKLTQTGMVLGTPQYLAPEQAQGRALTPAVDIYALGVMLFEILTGQVPFNDPSPLVVAIAHLSTPPPAPRSLRPDLPPAVEAVVLQALAKAPEDRFSSAGALAAAFQSAVHAAPAGSIHTMPTTATPVLQAARDDARARAGVHNVRTTINPALADQARLVRAAPPPDPLPEAAPPPGFHRPQPRQGRRTWLIVAGLGLALLAAAIVLRPSGGSVAGITATPGGATTIAGAPTAAPPTTTAMPAATDAPPTNAPAATDAPALPTDAPASDPFTQFRAVLAQAAANNLVDAPTATELDKKLTEVERQAAGGKAKELSKKLRDLEKAIDEAERKGRLDGGVADDLRALLAAISTGGGDDGDDDD